MNERTLGAYQWVLTTRIESDLHVVTCCCFDDINYLYTITFAQMYRNMYYYLLLFCSVPM